MHAVSSSIEQLFALIRANVAFVTHIILALWVLNIINWVVFRSAFNALGIYPRSWHGWIGILFSPILHGNVNHLFLNSIPLFVLINFVLLHGYDVFYYVTAIIVVLSGVATWIFGRRALHIGASGLISGYFGYLMTNAYHQQTSINIGLLLISLYYFGGILSDLIPDDASTSWEGHVFGFLAGLSATWLYPFIPLLLPQ